MSAHLFAHFGHWLANSNGSGGIFWLIGYTLNDRDRFRRTTLLLLFVGIGVVAWWLFAHGGFQVLQRDFGSASIARPGSNAR